MRKERGISGGREHKTYSSEDMGGALVNANGDHLSNSARGVGAKGMVKNRQSNFPKKTTDPQIPKFAYIWHLGHDLALNEIWHLGRDLALKWLDPITLWRTVEINHRLLLTSLPESRYVLMFIGKPP